MGETANPSTTIHHASGFRKSLLGGFGHSLRAWQKTLRYDGLDSLKQFARESDRGTIILLWHNRLFPVTGAFQHIELHGRRVGSLISASRDGAQLSHFMQSLGIHPVRGSSSRRGAMATRELLRLLKNGDHVAITVDGPRGPCYRVQAGAALLVQLTGAPVCCIGVECEDCFVMKSWDRFLVPKPFSRVKIKLDRFTSPYTNKGREEREAIQGLIQEKLTGLTRDLHERA